MRSTKDFTDLFYDILENKIPSDARDKIKSYWVRFHVTPKFLLSDTEIDASPYLVENAAALLDRFFIQDSFAFRDFIRNDAPDDILRTIIQHELIHCYLLSGEDYDDIAKKCLKEMRQIALNSILSPNSRFQFQLIALNAQYLEEGRVSQLNLEWGCDERAARDWCQNHQEPGLGKKDR